MESERNGADEERRKENGEKDYRGETRNCTVKKSTTE